MAGPEFVFLNGQAVRVTGWREDAATGEGSLVAITRGAADRDRLLELLASAPLRLRLEDTPERVVRAHDIDVRSTGAGPQAIYRITATFTPEPVASGADRAGAASLEDRLDAIERRLARIEEVVRAIRDGGSRG